MTIQRYRTALVRTRMPGGVGGGSREVSPYPDFVIVRLSRIDLGTLLLLSYYYA